jgi:hypothetical protein
MSFGSAIKKKYAYSPKDVNNNKAHKTQIRRLAYGAGSDLISDKQMAKFDGMASGKSSDKFVNQSEKFMGMDKGDIVGNQGEAIGGYFDAFKAKDQGLANQGQNQLLQALMTKIQGGQPTVADLTTQANRQSGLSQMLAQQRSGRGVNPALAARANQFAAANMNAQLGQQNAIGNIQEMNANQALLGTVSGQARGQDLSFQEMLQQQALAKANAQAQASNIRNQLNANYKTQGQANRFKRYNDQMNQFGEIGGKMLGGSMMGG